MGAYTRRSDAALPECPFYQSDPGNRSRKIIQCEGITDSSCVRQCFDTAADRRAFEGRFCCAAYARCKVYAAIILAKYEGA